MSIETSTDYRGTDNRETDQRGTDQRGTGHRATGHRETDHRTTDHRTTDHRATDRREIEDTRRGVLRKLGAGGLGVTLWPRDWWFFDPAEEVTFLFYNTWLLDGIDLPEVDLGWLGTIDLGNIGDKPQLNERASELGTDLDESDYDVVAMCENFRHEQRSLIEDQITDLNDSFEGPGSVPVGDFNIPSKHSGLHTLTTGDNDIVDTAAKGFDARGDWIRDADYYANKGVQYVEIDVGPGNVDLFTTHMIAGGGTGVDPDDLPLIGADSPEKYRAKQITEMRNFIEQHRKPENVTVVAGDFNINADNPGTVGNTDLYEVLQTSKEHLGLYDVWERHGGPVGTTFIKGGPPGGLDRGRVDPENTDYFEDHGVRRDYPDVTDRRIDYVFVEEPKPDHSFELTVEHIRRRHFWRRKVGALRFWVERDEVPNYLSDHIGLEVKLTAR